MRDFRQYLTDLNPYPFIKRRVSNWDWFFCETLFIYNLKPAFPPNQITILMFLFAIEIKFDFILRRFILIKYNIAELFYKIIIQNLSYFAVKTHFNTKSCLRRLPETANKSKKFTFCNPFSYPRLVITEIYLFCYLTA